MLVHLDIRDFAIVDAVSLDFEVGLTVLTGETGAGKSILIDAIGLLLGDRADSGFVRTGAQQADIAGQWNIDGDQRAQAWLEQHAMTDSDDPATLNLRRVVTADGRSRAFINGRPAPISALRDLGEMLIEIHGQHAHQLLRKSGHQRQLLDDFGDFDDVLRAVADAARHLAEMRGKLDAIQSRRSTDPAQLEYLRHQLEELEQLQLTEGELDQLEQEHQRLSHADSLLSNGARALAGLSEDEDAVSQRLSSIAALVAQLREVSEDFSEAASLVEQAQINADEAANSLRHALDHIEVDPERLQEIEQRLSSIHDLARKHRVRPEELPAFAERLRNEVAEAEAAGGDVAELQQAVQRAEEAYRKAAVPLSKQRAKAAQQLGDAVREKLAELAMPDARLEVAVRTDVGRSPSIHGDDDVELQFSANPGQTPRPLTRVASGGELSRISLALQTALSARANVGVMIFDEVDVGVGGATAEVVGRLLRHLSQRCQVLCVTHLPQVAAQGHQQITIRKRAEQEQTRVEARMLSRDDRRDELARMLGGIDVTQQTLKLADEMLNASAES
ncbi:DNA repair protein RecN [Algiphilus sp.]|uniref:DNA repair protein RecN n=1 Tax=Algiphilus sp. TaxID=1872431 RepID=UPI002A672D78|nr:DNA repair protein RecN [Pseudomonadota bacterium]